jgi:hypothetical protein
MLVSMDTLLRITGSAVVTDDAASTVNPVRTARLPQVPGDAGRDDILLALCFKTPFKFVGDRYRLESAARGTVYSRPLKIIEVVTKGR